MEFGYADSSRRALVMVSALLVSGSMVFGGVPVASADPFDDDSSTESVDSAPEPEAPEPDAPEAPEPEAPEPEAPDPGPAADEPAVGSGPEAPEPDAPQQESPGAGEPDAGGANAGGDEPPAPGDEPGAGETAPGEPPAPQNPSDDLPGLGDEDPIDLDLNTADVPDADERAAETGKATEVDPGVADTAEIDDLREIVDSQFTSTTSSSSTTTSSSWNQSVTSWSSSWVGYDTYYRPIIVNPYQSPLQIVYTYDDATRIVVVNPLERVIVDANTPGVYSFTALTLSPDKKTVATASVGSFSGGGYKPQPGQPPPAKPAAPKSFENVLVQLRYEGANSKPFRVKKLYDLGDDPTVGNQRRVLLDGEVPAWGQWTKTTKGEALFAIDKTQQLPGLNAPSQGPLPGYNVELVANEAAEKHSIWSNTWLWVGVAAAGVVALGAILFTVVSRRRRVE